MKWPDWRGWLTPAGTRRARRALEQSTREAAEVERLVRDVRARNTNRFAERMTRAFGGS